MPNKITELFEIDYPIVQAGMIWASGWKLASSVSNAGGLGIIGAGSMYPEVLKEHIKKCKQATDKPFAVNVPMLYPNIEEIMDIIMEEEVEIVFTSAGNPKTWTPILKEKGIKVVHVVSSVKFALKSEAAGVDAVVAEGFEAGGHNGREETTTFTLIPMVKQKLQIPLIAAGGIATGRGMLAAMILGADGVQIGSRFVASNEASSHQNFKQMIVDAEEGNTQLTLKESYARFVPEELTSQLQKDSILNVELGDQRSMEMAIFFSDIRDFTSISEKLSPEETFAFVNTYLSQMVPIVKKHKGFVNKFIGDAIMALYPGRNDDAVECAIDMFQALRKFNRQRELEEKAPIRIGIGINTGLMMLGTLGNEDRMEASVISNSVNLASRIEGLTKTYKVPCILSGHTVEKLTPNKYHLRWIDRVQVKGKEEYTEIYELMDCYEENRMIKLQENTPIFLRGIEQWKAGDLKEAGGIFRGLMEDDPDDYVPYIYWNRCKNGERWVEDGLGTRFLDMLRRSSD